MESEGEHGDAPDARPLRVVIVDDHPLILCGFRRLLAREGMEVAGEARDGAAGVALARALRPDIVVMDVTLPECVSRDVTRQLHAAMTSSRTKCSRMTCGR